MAKITIQELLHIASNSRLKLYENEIEPLAHHIQSVLTYAEQVREKAHDQAITDHAQNNIFRSDVVTPCDGHSVVNASPYADQNYFVVPRVLEHK